MAGPQALWIGLALVVGLCAAGEISTSRPFLIDSQVVDMQWVNATHEDAQPHDKTVFVRSARGSIYRSKDNGLNWVSQRDKMSNGEEEDEEPFQTRVQQMLFSQADAKYAVMRGYGETTWFTRDQGESYERREFGALVDLKMHPKNAEWVLASKYEGEFPERSLSLFMTKDFGKSWKKLVSNVFQFEWADMEMAGYQENTIFACVRKDGAEAKSTATSWDPNVDFVRTDDFFGSTTVVIEHGNRFAIHPPYWFVAAMNPDEEMEVKMWVSADRGGGWRTAHFPYQLSERSYRVVDTKEGSVFVQVTHSERDSEYANVYFSGADGKMYSLSLRHVVKDYTGMSDFERINGVDGVYIANTADMDAEPTVSVEGSLQAIFGGGEATVPKRTMITFDKGALWGPLKAPTQDSLGRSIQCTKDCSLHLNGKTSHTFGPVYSSPTSTGLIMATGNVGTHLHDRGDEVNTYFSRDAGRSWEEILKGSFIYEYGDHGALMVLADNQRSSNEIIYSWNEGLNWTHFQFWDHTIEIENIITEPKGTSQIFIIYGRRNDKGILMQLNFETVHERRCLGSNAPGSDASDYEEWTPSDALREGKCLLGRKVTYTRRKREARCFNGHDYDRQESRRNCACARTDYECDFGYQLNDKKECERVPDMPVSGFAAPEDCEGTFTVTKGYRRVPGDTCSGGEAEQNLEPLRVSCPGFGSTSLVILFVVGSLAVALAVFTYYRRKEGGMPDPWSSVGDFVDFVKEGGRSLMSWGGGAGRGGYRGLGAEMLDDDDFGLGDDDDEAQVLGESLHEYAMGPSSGSKALSQKEEDQVTIDLISLSDISGAPSTPTPAKSQPPPPPAQLPSAPVPRLEPPSNRK